MTSSWTAHPRLASPTPPGSAAERHPSDSGHGRWIFVLGPPWVRAPAVAHGPQRSLAVSNGSDEPQVIGPSAHAAEICERAIQIVVRRSKTWLGTLRPAAGHSGADPCQPQYQSKNHDGGKHERGPITGLRHPSGDEVHHHDRRCQAGQRHRHPSNRPRQKAR